MNLTPHLRLARLGALALALALIAAAAHSGERLTFNLNPDWKFIKADPAGAAAPEFNDAAWQAVSAPHTFNDVDTFDNWSTPGHRGEQIQWSGRTWYRKTFTPPASLKGKQVYLEFEGVRQVAEVYLNGKLLGVCKTGFTPFGFDLTPHLRLGAPNVLAVMADNRFMKDAAEPNAEDAKAAEAKAAAAQNGGKGGKGSKKSSGKSSGKKGSKKATESAAPAANAAAPAAGASLGEMLKKVNAAIPEELDQLQADQIPWNNPHWHPAHGGIYRNVRLIVTDPLHISLPLYSFLQTAGPYVYASDVSAQSAQIGIEVPLENGRAEGTRVKVNAIVFNMDGWPILRQTQTADLAAGAKTEVKFSGAIPFPDLWEPAYPYLYRVRLSLEVNDEKVDDVLVTFGIRSARWDVASGFWINGHHVKLHGWGQKPTQEWPGLGAALPNWMHYFTLDLMKRAGGNFVRWGHSAAGPAQIEVGDNLGIIFDQPGVDGESDTVGAAWKLRAIAFRDTLIYFRNNPSILVWEGGNQKVTREHAAELRGLMDKYDPHGGRAYAHRRADKVTAEFMTVGVGTEGGQEIKELPVFEGEYDREESPRRVWDDVTPRPGGVLGYPEAAGQTYQLTSEQFAANEVAQYVKKLGAPAHAGGANWIFSDSTSGGRVATEVARASGEVDGVRLPKEAWYVCQVMYHPAPRVHIIGHWTYPAGTKKTVYVASNCDAVELFVSGKSLGRGKVSDHYLFTFEGVGFEAGEIKAIGYKGEKPAAEQAKHTAGEPVALRLTPVRHDTLSADGSDIALIDVEAVDAKGERCPTFEQRVDFTVAGPAVWRGGYNSGKLDSINNPFLNLECGVNRVALRATREAGKVTVMSKCAGLKDASLTIEAFSFPVENGMTKNFPAWRASDMDLNRNNIQLTTAEDILPANLAPGAPAAQSAPKTAATPAAAPAGRFIKSFNYSGPTAGIRIERDAQDGKKVFVDRDLVFAGLPAALRGADYVQAPQADKLYNAVDLMQLEVKAGSVVTIAHDDRLPRPAWLTSQFKATGQTIKIDPKGTLSLFERRAPQGESLTLGTNTENSKLKACNMYLVFVSAGAETK